MKPIKDTAEVIAEIQALLEKYDMTGFATVSDAEKSSYVYKLDATWNCIKVDHGNQALRVKLKSGDYDSSSDAYAIANNTAWTIVSIIDNANFAIQNLELMREKLSKRWEIIRVKESTVCH